MSSHVKGIYSLCARILHIRIGGGGESHSERARVIHGMRTRSIFSRSFLPECARKRGVGVAEREKKRENRETSL